MSIRKDVYEFYGYACAWCHRTQNLEVHHKTFKGMGGRKGLARIKSESIENLILLCRVCHDRIHGIKAIIGDFSCEVCWRKLECPVFELRRNNED